MRSRWTRSDDVQRDCWCVAGPCAVARRGSDDSSTSWCVPSLWPFVGPIWSIGARCAAPGWTRLSTGLSTTSTVMAPHYRSMCLECVSGLAFTASGWVLGAGGATRWGYAGCEDVIER